MSKEENIKRPNLLGKFLKMESAGGVIMLMAAFIAIIMANTSFAETYKNIISYQLPFGFKGLDSVAFKIFVKDVMMVLFFFVIGMELKKETLVGFLAKRDQIFLPLIAAAAGMVVPAIIYSMANANVLATQKGWAIPSATDIAFALCVLSIFGRKVPASIKIFLLAIAIFDDLGAILIIAFFYSGGIDTGYLALSALTIGAMYYANIRGITTKSIYLAGGAILVVLFYNSGIHTTVAGVIAGFLIPLSSKNKPGRSTLDELMKIFHPWVIYLVLPIFAFVSAGVSFVNFDRSMLFSPITVGVTAGLFIGKQLGIFGIVFGIVKLKLADKPEGSSWKDIYAVSVLAGIGFTMSLFVSQLAFIDPVFQEEAKIGILLGSFLSAALGAIILNLKFKK